MKSPQSLQLIFSFVLLFTSSISVKNIKTTEAQHASPAISSGFAECVMEQNTRRILYENNGDLRLPMASTTKIATAITVIEACANLEERIIIPQEAEGVEGSSVYLKSGDEYTVQDLLYGLMLRSGNDCAMALSLYCSASVEDFAIKMNETAQKAGALQTQFKNPHGLPCKGHYTTARDLSLMTCYAMQNTTFREIVSTQYYERRHWKNKNKLLFEYDECIGVKTGYTKEAGRCLVSAGKRDGMTLICSVLNCADMYKRSETLLKEAFSAYSYVKIIDKSQSFSIADSKQKGKVAENVYYPLLPEERELIELKIVASTVKNKDSHGEIIGQIQIYLAKQLLFSQNLYKL